MFLRILKKDLKRNKTMNVILFLFTVLAAVFVASGLNNLVSVLTGTDYYLDQANVGDYIIISSTGEDDSFLKNVLDTSKYVKAYRMDRVCFGKADVVRDQNGKAYDNDNTTILQALGNTQMNFFDTNNQLIKSVKQGEIYLPNSFVKNQNLQPGDVVELCILDYTKKYVVAGAMKDALLGSTFMGNNRVLMNDADYDEILKTEGLSDYEGRIVNVDSDEPMKCKADFADVDRILFDDARSTIKITYVLDLIVAFIVVVLSICLMIVSFVLIRFSITFAITEDFREIGVMKAIGIRERKIRSLYMVKYIGLGLIGCGVGCIISFPFGNLLMKDVTENMVLGNSYGELVNLLGAALVFGLIVGFAYLATGRLKRMTPTDAIRSGETGERFQKKGGYRIGKSHTGNCVYLAINDILSSPGRFLNILISFTICTLFVLITSNTTATMDSNSCIDAFGTRADLYITDDSTSMNFMYRENGKEMMLEHLSDMEKELADLGMPGRVSIEMIYKYKFSYNGMEVRYSFQQGLNTKASEYVYDEGSAPRNKNEIAITKKVAQDMGMKIGDVIEIDFGDRKEKCTVTATFQSLNLLGSIIILHEDAPTSFDYLASFMQYKIEFDEELEEKALQARKERLKD
ncbi:MAG: ABC transporter permease [Lachnospiraceae bacterium]|nr:ABC transporter permease [Lachnospiraceae bacterium]